MTPDALAQFSADLYANHPPHTARSYLTSVRQLLDFLGDAPLDVPGLIRFHRYLGQRGYSKATLQLRLVGVRRYLDWLVLDGRWSCTAQEALQLKSSAHNLVRRRQVARPRIPERGLDERLRQAARGMPLRDRAMIELLYSSGCRRAELVDLDVGDLDLEAHSATVTGKGSKTRTIFYSSLAADLLRAYLAERGSPKCSAPVFTRIYKGGRDSGKRLSTAGMYVIFLEVCKQAGIEPHDFTPHSFRHAFAIRVLRETKDLALVQDLLGHADPKATRVYATIYPDEMAAAHKKVFG